jgi:hypothetical protein
MAIFEKEKKLDFFSFKMLQFLAVNQNPGSGFRIQHYADPDPF